MLLKVVNNVEKKELNKIKLMNSPLYMYNYWYIQKNGINFQDFLIIPVSYQDCIS